MEKKANIFLRTLARVPFIKNNFGQLMPNMAGIKGPVENIPQVKNSAHDPRSYIIPLQLQRVRQDIQTWRLAIDEAENAYYPHRYRMQQLFIDKVLEGHTDSVMTRRKNLTLLKEFKIGKRNSSKVWVENVDCSDIFKDKSWFNDLLNNIADAQFYGYSLTQLGDLEIVNKEYKFKDLTILKRWNVSPDRLQLVQIPYQTWGLNFMDPNEVDENGVSFSDWMIWTETPSDNGASRCGYGLLYKLALYGIIIRNNLSHNADYTQMFAAPYRHLKTPAKFGSDEYNDLAQAASEMASMGFVITSDQETIDFIQGNQGTGFQSYGDLEARMQKVISKLLLGHADAVDSTAGKLGSGQSNKIDEDASPVGKAIAEVEKKQDTFVLTNLNDVVLPKLRNLGFPIPEDCRFYVLNDKEEFEARKKEDAANLVTATIAQTMKNAGLKMDAKYYEDRTGIKTTDAPEPTAQPFGGNKFSAKMTKKLEAMYGGR